MDQAFYEEALAMTGRHLALSHEHINNQRRIIKKMKERGANSNEAESLLVIFLAAQKQHEYRRQQLIKELTKVGDNETNRT